MITITYIFLNYFSYHTYRKFLNIRKLNKQFTTCIKSLVLHNQKFYTTKIFFDKNYTLILKILQKLCLDSAFYISFK